jgi:hypothetical protein
MTHPSKEGDGRGPAKETTIHDDDESGNEMLAANDWLKKWGKF